LLQRMYEKEVGVSRQTKLSPTTSGQAGRIDLVDVEVTDGVVTTSVVDEVRDDAWLDVVEKVVEGVMTDGTSDVDGDDELESEDFDVLTELVISPVKEGVGADAVSVTRYVDKIVFVT